MCRIGKVPVAIPSGVTADIANGVLSVKGPKGTLTLTLREEISYIVEGVTQGFTKVLEITGVGYRAQAQGRNLRLQLGYSHDVELDVPAGLEVKTPDQTTIEISGIDKQSVGQFAAEIRRWRKPEPYKGKGIKYRGEYIFRKEGKKK